MTGQHPEVTPWILSVLKKENVKATFFLVGQQIEEFPELVGSIIKGRAHNSQSFLFS